MVQDGGLIHPLPDGRPLRNGSGPPVGADSGPAPVQGWGADHRPGTRGGFSFPAPPALTFQP